MNGYQLLNEVGSGGTLSSLFTILSLFTEDVKMSWQDDTAEASDELSDFRDFETPTSDSAHSQRDSDVLHFTLDAQTRSLSRMSVSSSASTIHAGSGTVSPNSNHSVPSVTRPEPVRATSIHRGIVARATEDTTLAVIPAEAFKRLTKNFPKATGHIVQGTPDPVSWSLT
jgi:lysophospholipid hydrolase